MRKSDFTLPTLDDLFSTQAERDDAKLERVRNIPLAELHPFKGHPFKVQNNEEMQRMIESIRKVGAITPALARPLPDGGYELTIDLPGFDKEGVQAELKDGYLTVTAETKQETEDKKGTYVRQERFSGKCSRTFYVGDDIEEGDIKAKFDNGTLQIDVPKKVAKPEPETSRSISID